MVRTLNSLNWTISSVQVQFSSALSSTVQFTVQKPGKRFELGSNWFGQVQIMVTQNTFEGSLSLILSVQCVIFWYSLVFTDKYLIYACKSRDQSNLDGRSNLSMSLFQCIINLIRRIKLMHLNPLFVSLIHSHIPKFQSLFRSLVDFTLV